MQTTIYLKSFLSILEAFACTKVLCFLDEGGFEAGAGFRTEGNKPMLFLESFEDWNPFPDDPTGSGRKNSVNHQFCRGNQPSVN